MAISRATKATAATNSTSGIPGAPKRVSFAKIHERLAFRTTASVDDGVAEVARLVRQGVLPDTADACYRN